MAVKTIKWKNVLYHWEIYLFILPTLVAIGLFQYWPSASGLIHSFYRWNGADISEYVGLDNFIDLFLCKEFWYSFEVAFLLGSWEIFKMIPAIIVAVCIHRCRSSRMQFLYRIMFVVPIVIPGLVVVLIWRSFFFEATNGYLNNFLYSTGLFDCLCHLDKFFKWGGLFVAGQNPIWLGDPKLILVSCVIWGFPWIGSFAILIYLAKLQGISKSIYEAAAVDGANWLNTFTKIELPLILGSIHLTLVFVIIGTIKNAGMILALAGIEGGPGGKATVPMLFMLRKAFMEQKMGYACAVGLVLTVIVMFLQKASNLMLNWSTLKNWQRIAIRSTMLIMAAFMIYSGHFVFLAYIFILFSFPYCIFSGIKKWLIDMIELTKKNPASITLKRYNSPSCRIYVKTEEYFVRFVKHLTIWTVLAFAFLPLVLMLIVSLKTNQQFYEAPSALTLPFHWENWKSAYGSVMPALANSIFISFCATIIAIFFALMAAYFFARIKMPLSSFFWNIILILMVMPTIANLVPLFMILKGMGLLNTLTALVLVGATGSLVAAVFVLRRFVADIPHDLFEAAEIDGASHLQQMCKIVLPLSLPILGTVGIIQFVYQWNQFILPLIIIKDKALLPVTVQLLRLSGEYIKFWGPLMAGYCLASIPVIVLFIFSMKLFIKGLSEGAVKG
jgi:ABC-type glycerol-3-phosphate transport system permease component